MNNPTCAQCDCVAGCQASTEVCPNVAQPEQPCMGCNGHGEVGGLRFDGYDSEICPFCKGAGTERIAQQEQTAEKCFCDANNLGAPGVSCGDCPTQDYNSAQPEQTPVCQPLTTEELRNIARSLDKYDCKYISHYWKSCVLFARAIEEAHGITKAEK